MSSGVHARVRRRCGVTRYSRMVTMNAAAPAAEFSVTLLPGDGIGPEILSVTKDVLLAVSRRLNLVMKWEEMPVGGAAIDLTGKPLPDETLKVCAGSDSVLLTCIGGYKWDSLPREVRPETGLLQLRKSLGLFANLRPAKVIPQLISASSLKPEIIDGVDIMVVRELTGDVYFGQPKGIEFDAAAGERKGYSNMIYYEHEIDRIAKVGFETARKRGKKLCSVDKANVLEVSQFWRERVIAMSENYDDVELSHMYVDNAAMQLVRWPKQFDTILTGNMFGDILSDEASMLVGSLGMLPSASLGDGTGPGLFEPIHGSAPDIAGKDLANPLACVLSAAMMFRYDLGQEQGAAVIERAVDRVLEKNIRTKDIALNGAESVGCKAMGEALLREIDNDHL